MRTTRDAASPPGPRQTPPHGVRLARYVAIGDSSTEGMQDPDGRGGYVGWSRRLAAQIAASHGPLLYANLGVRGLTTEEIVERQVEPAAAARPDLVTMFSGTNDVLRRRFDPARIERLVEHAHRTLIGEGASVLTFTLPDLSPLMPVARTISPRIRAVNDAIRQAAASSGATLLDFALIPVATDPRLWHEDRLHANARGHQRIADALAWALALPGSDEAWRQDLPPVPTPTRLARLGAELSWLRRYAVPWAMQALRSRPRPDAGAGGGVHRAEVAFERVVPTR